MKVRAARKAGLSPTRLCISIVAPTKVEEAKAALDEGEFERGLRLIEEAEAEQPEDPAARELYVVTHLARAIRLSDKAREARRADLLRRKIEYDVEFQDSPGAVESVDQATAAIEDVLRVDPTQWKARMLNAALLFRRDREPVRPAALEILHGLAAADPTNQQVPFTIRKIERPCARCGDTGFCSHCKARGPPTFLGMHRKRERCYGRGLCPGC